MSRANLERCLHLCAQRAWRLACALLHSPHDAADCVQQAFTAAARKPGAVPADDPWPWFSTVLFHEIRNHRRKRRPGPMPEEFDMQGQTPDPALLVVRQVAGHSEATRLYLAEGLREIRC